MIGAAGEMLALRVVAEHADIWICPTQTAEEFRHKSNILDEHCRAIGREPGEIARATQVLVSGDDPGGARRLLIDFIEAGCTYLVLGPRPPMKGTAWLAAEVIEPVLAEIAPG